MNLTFDAFRKANVTRCLKWHPAGIESWSPSDWLTAITGELGELASLVKMRNRERDGLPGNKFSPSQKQIADEIADVCTYLDLFAAAVGVDLGAAVVEKFNEVSARVGFPDRIAAPSASQERAQEDDTTATRLTIAREFMASMDDDNAPTPVTDALIAPAAPPADEDAFAAIWTLRAQVERLTHDAVAFYKEYQDACGCRFGDETDENGDEIATRECAHHKAISDKVERLTRECDHWSNKYDRVAVTIERLTRERDAALGLLRTAHYHVSDGKLWDAIRDALNAARKEGK